MSQKDDILFALHTRKRVPVWLLITPKPMGGLGIAQYNTRILELRKDGYDIVNRTDDNGHTYFELEGDQKTLF
jgi:hypothetical protein